MRHAPSPGGNDITRPDPVRKSDKYPPKREYDIIINRRGSAALTKHISSPPPQQTSLSKMSDAKLKKEAEAFQRVHPKEYLKKYLVKGIRPDGRAFLEARGLRITPASISTANGSSVVRIGKTIVVCGIKAEISEPTYDNPDSGYIGNSISLVHP